jgi:hypothetical protein
MSDKRDYHVEDWGQGKTVRVGVNSRPVSRGGNTARAGWPELFRKSVIKSRRVGLAETRQSPAGCHPVCIEGFSAMPALLSDVAPTQVPIFVPRLLGQRPNLAALVAETISTWSYAENALGRSVAAMSRGINAAEMEAYIRDWRLAARMKIVRRVAKAELQDPYLPTFLKGLDVIDRFAKRRHAFAHGIWGTVEALPDALLLVDPEHSFRHWGKANDWLAAFAVDGIAGVNQLDSFDNRHVEVWRDADLREEVDRMHALYELALGMEKIAGSDLFGGANTRRNVHDWLLKHPVLGL